MTRGMDAFLDLGQGLRLCLKYLDEKNMLNEEREGEEGEREMRVRE